MEFLQTNREKTTWSFWLKKKTIWNWGNKIPSKAEIWALIIFGILFLLIGALLSDFLYYSGILLIGAGLYLGLRPGGILRKEQVLESWSILIEDGQGKCDEVFQDTEDFIRESKATSLETSKEKMSPGIIGSFIGAKRDFLMVKARQSSMLSPYQIFVSVRDYGNNLDVSWYLTLQTFAFWSIYFIISFPISSRFGRAWSFWITGFNCLYHGLPPFHFEGSGKADACPESRPFKYR